MHRRTSFLVSALMSMVFFPVFAHEGHDHDDESLTEKQVAALATKTLPSLIQGKKIAATWAQAKQEAVTIRSAAGKDVWVVTYKNPSATDASGKPLFLFFDDLGNFIEANQSGKLAAE